MISPGLRLRSSGYGTSQSIDPNIRQQYDSKVNEITQQSKQLERFTIRHITAITPVTATPSFNPNVSRPAAAVRAVTEVTPLSHIQQSLIDNTRDLRIAGSITQSSQRSHANTASQPIDPDQSINASSDQPVKAGRHSIGSQSSNDDDQPTVSPALNTSVHSGKVIPCRACLFYPPTARHGALLM